MRRRLERALLTVGCDDRSRLDAEQALCPIAAGAVLGRLLVRLGSAHRADRRLVAQWLDHDARSMA